MNTRAASFYQEHGVQQVAAAYEKEAVEDAVLISANIVCVTVWDGVPSINGYVHLIKNPITWCQMTANVFVWNLIVRIVK